MHRHRVSVYCIVSSRRALLLGNDEVNDLSRTVDELLHLLALDELEHRVHARCCLASLVLRRIWAELHLSTHLAIHLDAQRDCGLDGQSLVKGWPGGVRDTVCVAQLLPHLLTQVGCKWRHEEHEGLHGLPGNVAIESGQVVSEDHHAGNGRVETELVHLLRHFLYSLMAKAAGLLTHLYALGGAGHEGGHFVAEAHDAGDLGRLPGLDRLQGAHKHLVHAHGVRAVLLHNVVRVDHVATRLGHLLSV
mmetsp:Transcript_13418/g.35810  ORF Transcript_13418/g.35810 Transcript_13418/m.35810 type:complete len:248 (-) Transcript_13418:259-1002(-)